MKLGINIESIEPYNRTIPFANVALQRSDWTTPDGKSPATLDADGDPVSDCACYLITGADSDMTVTKDGKQSVVLSVPDGDYDVSFLGTADLSGNFVVKNKFMSGGWTQGTITVPKGNLNLAIAFTNTQGKGVKRLQVLLPGHGAADQFNHKLVATASKFSSIRFMDYFNTNGTPPVSWGDRATMAGRQSGPRGASLEMAVLLCNQAKCDLWYNVPHAADEEFVGLAAAFIATNLSPGLNCYVAYSNEVWNGMFPQHAYNQAAAFQEQNAGAYNYKFGSPNDDNTVYWAFRRVARKTVSIGVTFTKAFKNVGADPSRVRPVLEHQVAWADMLGDMLAYISAKFAPPKTVLWGAAAGIYLNVADTVYKDKTLTADRLVATLRANLPQLDGYLKNQQATCAKYGIAPAAYELGIDIGQDGAALDQKVAAQNGQGMGGVVAALLKYVQPYLDVANWYTLAGPYNLFGYWGLTNLYLATTPKLDAAIAFAAATPAAPAATPATSPAADPIASILVTYKSGRTETITKA